MHFNDVDISKAGIFDVAENTSADLQDLIDRLRGGDREARRELLQRAYNRLLRIAATVFHEDFPTLRGRHDLESVVSEVWMRLAGALEATQPQTVEGFFGLVFHKVRQVLLDMASRQRRDDLRRCRGPLDADDSAALAAFDPPDTIVSKYMEGGDLATRLRRGRPTFSESAAIVAVLCDALHYTHTQDLYHRDIKPGNILLDAAGTPFLADFGLAFKDENVGQGARHLGTAAYMSPEQARGEGHLVDGRSDIFSIGVVLYELLVGRRPFRGGSHQELMWQITSAEPRPPRQIDDAIPQELK
jgi:DNA-directed RNA polymerase specialized sigma24 family protein